MASVAAALQDDILRVEELVSASRGRVAKGHAALHFLVHDESIRVVDAGRCMASERQDGQGIL